MKTITLHSNNRKAIWEAADTINRVGYDRAMTYCYFRCQPGETPLVIISVGKDVTKSGYQFHQTVEL